MGKKFSIVIPVYNGAEYIEETILSIINQSYDNYELIVVDGASTDNTMDKLQKYGDNITKLISEKDNGMYDAINKGFQYATGDVFCYINSDDRLCNNSLEYVNNKFNEVNFDLVYGDVNYISERGDIIYTFKSGPVNNNIIRSIRRLPFAQQSTFWTKELYSKIGGFDSSLKFVADSKFFFEICLNPNNKIGYIKRTLGEFRLRNNSLSIGSKNHMELESKRMRSNFKFNNNLLLRFFYEGKIKLTNLSEIYKKKTAKGPQL